METVTGTAVYVESVSTFITPRQRTRSGVSGPTVVWALGMTFVLCTLMVRTTNHHLATYVGIALCVVYGAVLGWQHRMSTVFVAPIISWFFAWVPLWVVEIISRGFFHGFFAGLFWDTIGWLLIGTGEFFIVGAVATAVRLVRGPAKDDATVTIIDPPTSR